MSGGHYDYACHRVHALADDILQDVKKHEVAGTESGFGTQRSWAAEDPEILAIMREAAKGLHAYGKLAHDVEWYLSGDYGTDTLKRCYQEWKGEGVALGLGLGRELDATLESHSGMLSQIAAIVAPYLPENSEMTTLEGVIAMQLKLESFERAMAQALVGSFPRRKP